MVFFIDDNSRNIRQTKKEDGTPLSAICLTHLFGKGYLKGTQSYLEYLPEKHTDFIFTLFSEEFGFLGSSILLMLYFVMLFRIIRIGQQSKSYFAKFYCFGFASALFIYITVNMSMVLGLLPIVGSPLPIMSYGGSA